MNLYCWLASFLILSVIFARAFYYFGTRHNGEGKVESAPSIEERALAAAWARRFATKDLQ